MKVIEDSACRSKSTTTSTYPWNVQGFCRNHPFPQSLEKQTPIGYNRFMPESMQLYMQYKTPKSSYMIKFHSMPIHCDTSMFIQNDVRISH